jgi:hypothetical protein
MISYSVDQFEGSIPPLPECIVVPTFTVSSQVINQTLTITKNQNQISFCPVRSEVPNENQDYDKVQTSQVSHIPQR